MGRRTGKRIRKNGFDYLFLSVVILLLIIGLVMVFSSSAIMADQKYNNMYFFMLRQLIWTFIGFIALSVGIIIDYKKLASLSKFGIITALSLLVMVLVPYIGHEVGHARRWLRFGGIGFQPSEFAKIAIIIYFASVLDRKFSKIKTFYKDLLAPLLLVLLIVSLIYSQPDFGSSALVLVTVGVMLFIGGVELKHLGIGLLMFIPFVAYAIMTAAYRKARFFSFLDPFSKMYGTGFQLSHSIMALGDGGWTGVGLGAGYQKLFYIPEVHTDFVFSIIGQELGFVGTMTVLVLFGLFTWRGIRIALISKDFLGKMLAAGLTFLISIQAIINIGVVTGCLPTKGLSLPFVSFGGSSLVFNMFSVGIILNISRKKHQKESIS